MTLDAPSQNRGAAARRLRPHRRVPKTGKNVGGEVERKKEAGVSMDRSLMIATSHHVFSCMQVTF